MNVQSLLIVIAAVNKLAVIHRPGPKEAEITYKPTMEQQRKLSTNGIKGQFVVMYDVDRKKDAGDLLVIIIVDFIESFK